MWAFQVPHGVAESFDPPPRRRPRRRRAHLTRHDGLWWIIHPIVSYGEGCTTFEEACAVAQHDHDAVQAGAWG
jgi:hypothetical protein